MVFATDQQPYNWDNGPNGVLMNCYVSLLSASGMSVMSDEPEDM